MVCVCMAVLSRVAILWCVQKRYLNHANSSGRFPLPESSSSVNNKHVCDRRPPQCRTVPGRAQVRTYIHWSSPDLPGSLSLDGRSAAHPAT